MIRRAPSRNDATVPVARLGPIVRTLERIGRTLRWLALSLLVSIVVEWIGMVLWWPEAGIEHSRAMLRAEIAHLTQDVRQSLITDTPAKFAADFAERARHLLFEISGVERLAQTLARPVNPSVLGLRMRLRQAYQHIVPFVHAAMTIVQVFAVRLAVLALAIPTFVLFSLVGLVDGLVRRDLRRWGGGRESSFLYHYAKGSVWRLVLIAWVTYLTLPFSLHPALILLPFATLFAISTSITAGTFKKYI